MFSTHGSHGKCNPQRNPFSVPQESHTRCAWDAPCQRSRRHQNGCFGEQVQLSVPDRSRTSELLCKAIENGDTEFCRFVLTQKLDWKTILRRDGGGRYTCKQLPLHTMFLSRYTPMDGPILQLLLCSGLDLNLPDTFGRTAMHCLMTRIHAEQSHSSPACSRPAPTRSKDFNVAVDCVETLVKGGADINRRDGSQQTSLHLVAFYNIPSCVSVLCGFGAEPDTRDINGNTPLHICAMFSHAETMRPLLHKGANPKLGNARGETPLHIASRNYAHTGLGCIKLLLAAIDDVNQRDDDMNTALHQAVGICTKPEIISRLLNRGADPDLRNAQGQSALFLYLNSKLVEQRHQSVLRPSHLHRIRLPDLGQNVRHSACFCLLMDNTTYVRIKDKDGRLPRLLTLRGAFDLAHWLHRLTANPPSLLFLSRQAVRSALRPARPSLEVCRILELPEQVADYVVNPVYKKDSFAPWVLSK